MKHSDASAICVQRQFGLVQGSLRTFMRGYLPRLRRHLRRQRP